MHGRMPYASGGEVDTTISRMELTGPIHFLEWLFEEEHFGPSLVLINSDSEYVVKGANDRGRTRNMHHDLWNRLDAAVDAHVEVQFDHVKGHANNFYNHRADELAGKARKTKQDELSTN
jgi:ribonuclease HI